MVGAQLGNAFGKVLRLNFNAASLWLEMNAKYGHIFDYETYDELCDLGETKPKAIRYFVRQLRAKDNAALLYAIEAAYKSNIEVFANAVEDGIVAVCLKDNRNALPGDLDQWASLWKLIFEFYEGQDSEKMTNRQKELLEQLKTKMPASFISAIAAESPQMVNEMEAKKALSPEELHWDALVKTIDANYGLVMNSVVIESGELGSNLVSSGFLTGVDLKHIQKNQNPNQVLIEEYVKIKPSLWTLFLETLKQSGQDAVAAVLSEEYEKISADLKNK